MLAAYHWGLKLIAGGLVLEWVRVVARQAAGSAASWMHPVVIQLCMLNVPLSANSQQCFESSQKDSAHHNWEVINAESAMTAV